MALSFYDMQTHERIEVLKEIAEERLRLSLALAALSRRHNALIPISILPLELLIKVFRDALQDRPSSTGPLGESYRALEQVSHHWRETLVSSPSIWSRLINLEEDSYPWTLEILRRSRDAPIVKMDLTYVDAHQTRILQLVVDHAARLKSLAISSQSFEVDEEVLGNFLITPAPILEELSLTWYYEDRGEDVLPKSFFLDNFPNVSSLQATNFSFTFPMNDIFRKLTEIDVGFYWSSQKNHYVPSGAGWLEIVRDAPLLRKLIVHHAFGDYSESPNTPIPHISSPSLLSVNLQSKSDASFNGIVTFLSHISLHPDCFLDIVAKNISAKIGIKPFLQSVERHVKSQQLTDQCIHSYSLSSRNGEFHLRKRCLSCDRLEFQVYISWKSGILPAEVVPSLGALTPNACSLTPSLAPDRIAAFLRPFDKVRNLLECGSLFSVAIIPHLTIRKTKVPHANSNSALLPNLRTIEFSNLAFTSERDLRSLKKCLASRRDAGKPISRIEFIGCHPHGDEMLSAHLRSLGVTDIVWTSKRPLRGVRRTAAYRERGVRRYYPPSGNHP